MKKIIFFVLIFTVLFASCKKDSAELQTKSKYNEEELTKELRQTVYEIWEDANNTNIEKLKFAHYESSKFSKFGPRISQRQSLAETNKSEAEHFSSIKDVKLVIEDLTVDIFENIGIATFYNNYSFIKNDISIKGKGRVTLAFLKTPNGWKIIHEHSSPFNE